MQSQIPQVKCQAGSTGERTSNVLRALANAPARAVSDSPGALALQLARMVYCGQLTTLKVPTLNTAPSSAPPAAGSCAAALGVASC